MLKNDDGTNQSNEYFFLDHSVLHGAALLSMTLTLNDIREGNRTDEDHHLARKIYDAVQVVNATVKEKNWNRWANSIRLMREQDRRTHDEIWHVFDSANWDTFWSNNVLSLDSP